jgi:hypothetical protein
MTDNDPLMRRQIWTSVHEVLRQLNIEHPDASDDELMKLLIRELTGRLDYPKTEPEAKG